MNEKKRQKVRMSGSDSLADVARRVFRDDRLVALLADINPKVPTNGPLKKGTIIQLPGLDEARAFAKKMGFSLGFDPSRTGGTRARRAWDRLSSGKKKSQTVDPEPKELVMLLGAQDLSPDEVAKRIIALCSKEKVAAFTCAAHDDEACALVAGAIEAISLRERLRPFISGLLEAVEATGGPRGRERLIVAFARDGAVIDEVLEGLLVVKKLRNDLGERAMLVEPLLERARAWAKLDPDIAQLKLEGLEGDEAKILPELVAAARGELGLLDDERLTLLGVDKMFSALEKHLGQIAKTLSRLLPHVERVHLKVLKGVLEESDDPLPKPWPIVQRLYRALSERVARAHAGRRELGLAGLVPLGAESGGSKMNAAEIAARAAHEAKVAKAHDEMAERLGPVAALLFDVLRPAGKVSGDEAQHRQRRRTRFNEAMLTSRAHVADPRVIVEVLEKLWRGIKGARRDEVAKLHRAVDPKLRARAASLAAELDGEMVVMLKGATEMARAVLIATFVLDDELAMTLSTSAGKEAARRSLKAHGTRILSFAAQRYTEL